MLGHGDVPEKLGHFKTKQIVRDGRGGGAAWITLALGPNKLSKFLNSYNTQNCIEISRFTKDAINASQNDECKAGVREENDPFKLFGS